MITKDTVIHLHDIARELEMDKKTKTIGSMLRLIADKLSDILKTR